MVITDRIERKDWSTWYLTLCANNGRFVRNPEEYKDGSIGVVYTFDDINDYTKFCEEYKRLRTPIVEKKPNWFKETKQKLVGRLKFKQ